MHVFLYLSVKNKIRFNVLFLSDCDASTGKASSLYIECNNAREFSLGIVEDLAKCLR